MMKDRCVVLHTHLGIKRIWLLCLTSLASFLLLKMQNKEHSPLPIVSSRIASSVILLSLVQSLKQLPKETLLTLWKGQKKSNTLRDFFSICRTLGRAWRAVWQSSSGHSVLTCQTQQQSVLVWQPHGGSRKRKTAVEDGSSSKHHFSTCLSLVSSQGYSWSFNCKTETQWCSYSLKVKPRRRKVWTALLFIQQCNLSEFCEQLISQITAVCPLM